MVILFRFRIIFLFILFYSCQGQNDQAKQSVHKYPNLQIVDQLLKHEISEYKEMIDSTNISSKVLYVFYQQQSDETQLYHIGCYLGAYSFYNSNIQMIYEYENYLITFKIDGISAFRLDSLSRMNIIEKWFPSDFEKIKENLKLIKKHPDIDLIPPPVTGSAPTQTIIVKDGEIIERRID